MLTSDLQGKQGLALLRSVGGEVVAEWSKERGTLPQDSQRVAEIVDQFLSAVEEDEGVHLAVGVVDESDLHLCNRVLREMRVRLLGIHGNGAPSFRDGDPAEILWAIDWIERTRLGLWASGDEDLAHRFLAPDAFELLVEVGHDIRSPLSSILFLSETLRGGRSGEVNDLQKRQLGLIYSAALGLQSISSDVVDSARGGRGIADEDPAPFSISEIFDRIREVVRPVADEKGLELEFRRPDRDRFLGHAMPLSRALLNLTTNALKFTEVGVVTVAADHVDRGVVEFSVSDTGRGMNEQQLRLLYQPFRKSEYRSGHFFSGSGLGLSIARRFLAAMGSELEVESEVGTGTRFWFRIALPSPSL